MFDEFEKPIFIQLAEEIEDSILKGVYPEEGKIPSVAEISAGYRINPATANKSVALLADGGVVYKKRGIGMYVSIGAADIIKAKRVSAFYDKYVEPMCAEAKKLNIERAMLDALIGAGMDEDKE